MRPSLQPSRLPWCQCTTGSAPAGPSTPGPRQTQWTYHTAPRPAHAAARQYACAAAHARPDVNTGTLAPTQSPRSPTARSAAELKSQAQRSMEDQPTAPIRRATDPPRQPTDPPRQPTAPSRQPTALGHRCTSSPTTPTRPLTTPSCQPMSRAWPSGGPHRPCTRSPAPCSPAWCTHFHQPVAQHQPRQQQLGLQHSLALPAVALVQPRSRPTPCMAPLPQLELHQASQAAAGSRQRSFAGGMNGHGGDGPGGWRQAARRAPLKAFPCGPNPCKLAVQDKGRRPLVRRRAR
jgi:hypothetical protein